MNEKTNVDRLDRYDWANLRSELDLRGWTVLSGLLEQYECVDMTRLYDSAHRFRKRVIMAQHGFGRGEYQYFSYPLPAVVEELRSAIYSKLVPVANGWNERMRCDVRFPNDYAKFLERCHAGGQTRPTPLLLRYGEDDYNCLHQDLYGEHVFPLQLTTLLSSPHLDFAGGAFVITEQRPRMQSKVEVVPLDQGDAVIFAVNSRPVRGLRGDYRVHLRHGVSRMRAGSRHTLGIIFHDAT